MQGIRGAQGDMYWQCRQRKYLGDILRALEGDLSPVDCAEINNTDTPCSISDTCVTKYVWKRIRDSINDAVDGIMLSDLVAESKRVQAEAGVTEDNNSKQTC